MLDVHICLVRARIACYAPQACSLRQMFLRVARSWRRLRLELWPAIFLASKTLPPTKVSCNINDRDEEIQR